MALKEDKDLKRIEKIARLLDSRFRIPGTRLTFGIEPLINLVPFAGDAFTLIIQGLLTLKMLQRGASGEVATRMMINIVLDTLLGGIPIIGQIADFFFKANTRNLKLLKEHYEKEKHKGSAEKVIIIFSLALLAIFILIIVIFVLVIRWLWHLFQ